MVRERVDRRLDRAREVPLTMVVGPAGSGKTTAASHLVQRSGPWAVWYRAHPVDGQAAVLCEHLVQAVAERIGRQRAFSELAEFFVATERASAGHELLLVIDEFDAVIGTESEAAISELLPDLGSSVHLVTLSRQRPRFNVSKLRLGSAVCEIGPDDLRFRSWEIDQLFRELYRRPLLPDEVAELERKTSGWVAALQLFNLATTSLNAGERRATIAHVGRRNGPDWDFLADNVLSGLPDELQLFLLETAPLERLTASLCDAVLDQRSSGQQLAELERLQLITPSMDSPGSFRSHEVLRAHLDGLLMEWEGADAVRKRYRRVAEALEDHGQYAEALRAYCRGDDWASAARLLGSRGAEVADRPGSWLVALPPSMVEADPWLLLAVARQQRANGRVADAIDSYQRVERSALTSSPVMVARRERLQLASLVDMSSPPSLGWVAALRDAAATDPVAAVAGLSDDSARDLFARGIAELLAGDVRSAEATLRKARDRSDASPTLSVAAGVGLVIAAHLAGSPQPLDGDDLERAATALEVPLLIRMARAAAGLTSGSVELVESVAEESEREGDAAGAAAAWVMALLAAAWGPAPADVAHSIARDSCRALGLRTLETWALVATALVTRTRDAAADAETAARRGSLALQDLAQLAVVLSTTDGRAEVERRAAALQVAYGLAMPVVALAAVDAEAATPATATALRLQCFGQFTMSRDGVPVDLRALRPRARAVLRMLATRVGSGFHRLTLCDELWPDDDEAAATKKLQVAVSSIRRALESAGAPDVLVRNGEVYLIDRRGDVECDVDRFEAALGRARSLLATGTAAAESELRVALELHAGELLPEDGTAEWVVDRRRELRAAATEAARSLASLLLDQRRASEAIGACRAGLAIDRYDDPLWRSLLTGLELDGDLAGHALASSQYDDMLAELGVTPSLGT